MNFFAQRKIKKQVLKVNLRNPDLDKTLTARQVLHMFAVTNNCQSLDTAVLQYSKLEDIPEDIRSFFVEETL